MDWVSPCYVLEAESATALLPPLWELLKQMIEAGAPHSLLLGARVTWSNSRMLIGVL